jgi:hypothetical protein
MIIVPVLGDEVKTKDGLPSKVISYTNYKPAGPAVIVSSGASTDEIQFSDIISINNQEVKLLKDADGYNVFEITGYLKRKFELPQPGEYIQSDVSGTQTEQYKVQRVRLHVQGKSSSGIILDVLHQDETAPIEITLNQITDIKDALFNKENFLKFYSDYTQKGS